MNVLNALFDFILIDTAQVLNYADTIFLSGLIDGIILIVSLNNISKKLSLETKNKLISNKIPLLGIISNEINSRKAKIKSDEDISIFSKFLVWVDS